MDFPHGVKVTRERRQPTPDPYNPGRTIPGSWEDALDVITLESCFIDFSSSSAPTDATRSQIWTNKALHCTESDVDVKAGDRIRDGADVFYVNERPAFVPHPFTGWCPPVEIPLELTEG